MKFKFSGLVGIAALLVAGCAAYYSIFGISHLFAGASLAVIIMASCLEFSKIVSVSLLQRYWSRISKSLKFYLLTGVFILICITSAGIYGFLSNAYQKTANQLEINDGQISVVENKKNIFQKNIDDNNTIIETKRNRLNQLNDLRTNQESRLDNAKNNLNRSRARGDIDAATKEIQKLNLDIDDLNNKNTSISDSVNYYSNKIIELKSNNNVAAEIGPLKYLAKLTGYPMDKVVNIFILLLIFVFDPLAVALVIATNKILELEKEDKKKSINEPVNEPVPMIYEDIDEPETMIEEELFDENSVVNEEEHQNKATNKIRLEDIKEIKENRGFSKEIPKAQNNTIERIGSNKFIKDSEKNKVYFKRNR